MDVTDPQQLIQILRHSDPHVRARAAYRLSTLKEEGEIYADEVLKAFLEEYDEDVSEGLIYALGKLRSKNAVEVFLEILDKDIFVNTDFLLEALGEIGDERAITPLAQFINKYDQPENRYLLLKTAEALGKIGKSQPEAIAAIKKVLKYSLSFEEKMQALEPGNALLQLGEGGYSALVDGSEDINAEVRISSVAALSKDKSQRTQRLMKSLLSSSKDDRVKGVATYYLSKF